MWLVYILFVYGVKSVWIPWVWPVFNFGFVVESINQVTLWIVNALWAGYTAANVLKWFWWRLSGYRYFWAMVTGIGAAPAIPMLFQNVPALDAFPYLLVLSLLGCLLGSYLTKPAPSS